MATVEEDDGGGIPEWVVTFGDMMSLLLTFFIMLVSMSEIKEQKQYQALVDSMRRRFGHDLSMASLVPGMLRPRNSNFKHLASMGRARRANTMRGGDKVRAAVGDNPRVRNIRAGREATIGGVIYFQPGVADLSKANKRQLQITAQVLGGKAQKIEIRGHTARGETGSAKQARDAWDLAYARCRNTMAQLTELGIDPRRIRIAVAADNEPAHIDIDATKQQHNARVEVTMLNERVQDLEGTAEERTKTYVGPSPRG